MLQAVVAMSVGMGYWKSGRTVMMGIHSMGMAVTGFVILKMVVGRPMGLCGTVEKTTSAGQFAVQH